MNDTATVDWRDYIIEEGYFHAEIPAHALDGNLAIMTEKASITVETGADDEEQDRGITVGFWLPHILADVRFEIDGAHPQQVHGAREYADAITAAAATPETFSAQLHAWSNEATPDLVPVPVQVTTADVFDGVYLDMTEQRRAAVLLSRDDAAHLAQLIHAAIDYLIAHGVAAQ